MYRGVPMLVIIVLFRIDNPASCAYYGIFYGGISYGAYYCGILWRHLVEYPAVLAMHDFIISGSLHCATA